MIPYVITPNTLLFLNQNNEYKTVLKTNEHYSTIVDLVRSNLPSECIYGQIDILLQPKLLLEVFLNHQFKNNKIALALKDAALVAFVDGKEIQLPDLLAKTLLNNYVNKQDITPLLKFIVKLQKNPSEIVKSRLWDFIQAAGLTLDTNGNFLAYKNVNTDFTSAYDCKTDNSPGTVVAMPRNEVNQDDMVTCSHGLHFAAWEYLAHYAPGRKTVLVSVSPKDVVSIPIDYNNQKGRACRYKIVRETVSFHELYGQSLFLEDNSDYDDESDYEDYFYDDEADQED